MNEKQRMVWSYQDNRLIAFGQDPDADFRDLIHGSRCNEYKPFRHHMYGAGCNEYGPCEVRKIMDRKRELMERNKETANCLVCRWAIIGQ